jgi:DNA-binding response OmpR family regulator
MRKEIMIIDDSKPTLSMLYAILKTHHKVESYADGLSAMRRLSDGAQPDLIIMDPDLPDHPDWQLVKHLSTHYQYSSIPLMILSDGPEQETRQQVVANGVLDYHLKPFNPISLMRSVDNILMSTAMGPIY